MIPNTMVDLNKIEAELFRKCVRCGKIKLYVKTKRLDDHRTAVDGDGRYWRGCMCFKCYSNFKAELAQNARNKEKVNEKGKYQNLPGNPSRVFIGE